jgi:hypothetical protein
MLLTDDMFYPQARHRSNWIDHRRQGVALIGMELSGEHQNRKNQKIRAAPARPSIAQTGVPSPGPTTPKANELLCPGTGIGLLSLRTRAI